MCLGNTSEDDNQVIVSFQAPNLFYPIVNHELATHLIIFVCTVQDFVNNC